MNVRRLTIACLGSAGLLAACNGILGIEDAQVDPTFRGPASADAAATGNRCEVYCRTITDNCIGTNKQYSSQAVCLDMCPVFLENPGKTGDSSGNSLECRITHATFATNDPALHCPHAGVLGNGACGDKCESFCAAALTFCKPPNIAANIQPYLDEQVCQKECASFILEPGAPTLRNDGDSLNCRLEHLQRAHQISASEHCPHIATDSATCFGLSPDAGPPPDARPPDARTD